MPRHPQNDPNATRKAERAERAAQNARPNHNGETIVQLPSAGMEEIREDVGVSDSAARAMQPSYEKGTAAGVEEEQARVEEAIAAAEQDPEAPQKTRTVYTVIQDKIISSNGVRTTLRAGKEIDPLQYNVKDLKGQGVRMSVEEVPVY